MGFWHTMVEVFPHFMSVLLEGAVIAVEVAAGALVVALIGGLVLALATLAPIRPLRIAGRAYIELIRGTPALTQLFIIYFGLADIGLGMPPQSSGSVATAPPISPRSIAPGFRRSIAANARRRCRSASCRRMSCAM